MRGTQTTDMVYARDRLLKTTTDGVTLAHNYDALGRAATHPNCDLVKRYTCDGLRPNGLGTGVSGVRRCVVVPNLAFTLTE